MSSEDLSYKRHRFPVEVISHAVWLYHRFALSYRDVSELLLERGIEVSHESIRAWCDKFGPAYARRLRHRRPRPGDKWHLDEVFVQINGVQHYLWRAVDQDGTVLEVLVQSKRNTLAAKRFFRKLLKGLRYVPRVVVTDKLRSYGAAHRQVLASVQHRSHKGLNNRAENSHQPTRVREKIMKGFASVGQGQKFLAVFSTVCTHFRLRRHLLPAPRLATPHARTIHRLARNHRDRLCHRGGVNHAPHQDNPSDTSSNLLQHNTIH